MFCFHAEVLEGGEVEVGEGVVVGGAEGEVLAVLVAAAAEEDGHVAVVVGGGVTEIRGEEDHGFVEEFGAFELAEEVGPAVDGGLFDDGELVEFFGALSVVGEGVVGFFDAFERADGIAGAVEGDEAGGIGLEGEEDGVEEGAIDVGRAVTIGSGGHFDALGFRLVDPGFIGLKAELEFANGGEPFVEFFAVAGADLAFERFAFGTDDVHDGFSAAGDFGLLFFCLRAVFDEEGGEEFARVFDRGDHRSVFGVGGGAVVPGVENEGGKTGLVSEVLGHELIDRDGVFGIGAATHGTG